jgi:5-methylcytosine-specific restriction endonuclease McrA
MSAERVPDFAARECVVDGCWLPPCAGRSKLYCQRHYRYRMVESHRKQRESSPELRARIAAYKRSRVRQKNLKRYCTEAYLRAARTEDRRYATALRNWLKSFRIQRNIETGVDPAEAKRAAARASAKRRYWEDPEAARLKSQTFKQTRPDYREQWNAKRGKLELELSDGTLTRESVARLFTESKRCPYCGDQYKKSRRSLDHIVPLAKANGRKLHSISNVMVCCFACNNKKRTKGLNQFLEELKASSKKNAAEPREAGRILRLFATNG